MNLTTIRFVIFMRDLFSHFCESRAIHKIKTTKFSLTMVSKSHFNLAILLAILTAIDRANQIIGQRNKLEGGTRPRTKAISPLRTAGV